MRRPPPDDPAEVSARAARSQSRAAWVQNVLLVVALLVGGGGGFAAGRSTEKARTKTVTVGRAVDGGPGHGSKPDGDVGAVPCAPGPGPSARYEPNNSTGTAAGPVSANKPLDGAIATGNDVDYFAICVSKPVDLTLTLSCRDASDSVGCGGLFGEFPKDADVPGDFEPGRALACSIPARGRYVFAIEENASPAKYEVTVQTQDPGAVVSELPASLAPPDPNQACGK